MLLAVEKTTDTFHSFTGCDTVSSFHGKGNKTAWNVWQRNPEVTPELRALLVSPVTVTSSTTAAIHEYVIKMYDLEGQDVDLACPEGFFYRVSNKRS